MTPRPAVLLRGETDLTRVDTPEFGPDERLIRRQRQARALVTALEQAGGTIRRRGQRLAVRRPPGMSISDRRLFTLVVAAFESEVRAFGGSSLGSQTRRRGKGSA